MLERIRHPRAVMMPLLAEQPCRAQTPSRLSQRKPHPQRSRAIPKPPMTATRQTKKQQLSLLLTSSRPALPVPPRPNRWKRKLSRLEPRIWHEPKKLLILQPLRIGFGQRRKRETPKLPYG